MSIRYKILFFLLLIAFFVLSGVVSSYYIFTQASMKKEVVKGLEGMANVQQQRLIGFIKYNDEKLKLISSRTQMRISLKRYQESGDKKELAMVNRIISDAAKESQDIEDILIMGLDGKVLSSLTHLHDGNSFSDYQFFISGKKQNFASAILRGGEKSVPEFFFSAPLRLKDHFIGVIAMQVNMNYLNRLLKDYTGLGDTGEVLMGMETEKGNILLFSPLRFKESPLLIVKDSDYATPMHNALLQKEMLMDNALDYRQESVIAITRYLDEMGLGIVVKIDQNELLASRKDLQIFMIQSIIGMILIILVASFILSRVITKPVIDITQVATLISNGELHQRVHTMTEDELGQLARALNNMADNLIDANSLLEQKVHERTIDLTEANKRLEELAQVDGLTNIANRRSFNIKLEEEWKRSIRMQTPISLIMIDLDYFKEVNDILGHQVGDKYLKTIASVLSESTNRPGDLVARYGGEEFAVILQGTSETFAEVMAETIRKKVLESKIEHPKSDVSKYLTISAGVTTKIPKKNEEVSLLIAEADKALYKAKEAGRNKIIVWSAL